MKKLSTNQITTFYSISVFFKEIHRKASLQEKFHIQWIILLLCKFLSGFQVKTLEYFNNIKYFPRKENNLSLPVFYNSVVMRNIIKYPRIVPKPLIYWFTDTDIEPSVSTNNTDFLSSIFVLRNSQDFSHFWCSSVPCIFFISFFLCENNSVLTFFLSFHPTFLHYISYKLWLIVK